MTVGGTTHPAAPAEHRRRPGRKFSGLAAFVIGMFTLLPATAASAHAFLAGSNPVDGAMLASAPTELRLDFSESIVLDALVVDIVDGHGRHFHPTGLHLTGGAADDTEEPAEVLGTLPPLAHDAYRMSWQTLSSDDLHRTNGVLVFGIGQSVTAAGSVEPAPRPDEVLLRAAIFLSLSLSLGGLLAGHLLRRAGGDDVLRTADRCRQWARRGALSGIVCCVGLLADQVAAGGISLSTAMVSNYGAHVITRVFGFILLLIAAAGTWRLTRWLGIALIAAGATAVGFATALMGHAGAGLVLSTTRVTADAAHLLAAATWSGTLFLAVVVALPHARRTGSDAVHALLRAFGVPAAICVAVMAVSGVYLASSVVGSIDALLLTFYGRTLILKLCVVVVVGALGLVNARRLRSKTAHRLPVRTTMLETGAAAMVLFLAAILTSSQPALEPAFIAGPVAVPVRDGAAGDLQQTVAVRPNLPGKNVILIGVFDTRKPSPAAIRAVSITLVGPDGKPGQPVAATGMGDGQWSVTTDIAWTSHYSMIVTVQRPGLPDQMSSFPWIVTTPSTQPRVPTVSNAAIGGPLRTLSGILLLGMLLAVAAIVVRRRRARQAVPDDGDPVPAPSPDLIDAAN